MRDGDGDDVDLGRPATEVNEGYSRPMSLDLRRGDPSVGVDAAEDVVDGRSSSSSEP